MKGEGEARRWVVLVAAVCANVQAGVAHRGMDRWRGPVGLVAGDCIESSKAARAKGVVVRYDVQRV